jgi:lipoprotein-releasing system permease protein
LSLITLISLAGVALGVLVLVVVLAVMAGLEREIKSRLLGFTPHVLVEYAPDGGEPAAADGWREVIDQLRGLAGIEAATPFVQDNVVLDFEGYQRPVVFRAIDSTNPAEVNGVAAMLDRSHFPASSADLGLDPRAIVSSIVASQFRLEPGDTIRLYSTRNFREVMRVYKITERPPVREEFAAELATLRGLLESGWRRGDGTESVAAGAIEPVYESLRGVFNREIRPAEEALIGRILDTFKEGTWDDAGTTLTFAAGAGARIRAALDELAALDRQQMDADILRGMREIVLPKEVEVIGVYQASQHVLMPDLFVPLQLGQELVGLGDAVQGVALRVADPYRAGVDRDRVMAALAQAGWDGWRAGTWMDQYQAWFSLIARERVMMYFVLSFIFLISAFSMGAVMFAVTIQKRTEIGVMKALGATPAQVGRVFLYQGMVVGACGSLLGVLLGRLVIHFRKPLHGVLRDGFGFDPFPASFHGFDTIPAHMSAAEHLWICLGALVLCSLAALIPALPAARCDAARSLRNL